MRDPLSWSIPLGRLFGVTIRVHLLFPLVALGMILRASTNPRTGPPLPEGAWIDATLIMGFLFFSVLLHEFGHCFGARAVNGEASEVLLWPLGGLAYCDVPHTPRANFICTVAGPAVNLVLGLLCVLLLFLCNTNPETHNWQGLQPPWSLLGYPGRGDDGKLLMTAWTGESLSVTAYSWQALLSRFFWVNWISFLLNVVLIGYPLDGGRIFQSIMWNYVGYRKATLAAVFAGFVTMCLVALWSIVANDLMPFLLAVFIYQACQHQWMLLETGGEDSVFGYDFSQGYTSLERDKDDAPPPPQRKLSWWQRWLQRRAARKIQRELEDREADERRMDQLLEKISTQGMTSLTDEEKRFMKQFSDRYRNRNNS
jgi:stage IV sporulation protein FB